MINDFTLQVSTAQAVTATAVSTDSIDLSSAGSAGPFSVVIRFGGKRPWCPYFGQVFKVVGDGLESVI